MSRANPGHEEARRHAKHVRDFAYHLMTYVFACSLLVILDLRVRAGDQAVLGLDWAYWVILFWGLGVVGHAISVFLGDQRATRTDEHRGPFDRTEASAGGDGREEA